uniref:Uncharacterized protein n=1 Tax=Caenorhabditis japonica TaxID=281687 RepID=A0A8R1I8Q2_CAEJA
MNDEIRHHVKTQHHGEIRVTAPPPALSIMLSDNCIDTEFITPLSPWKGGIYERMVGITKNHLFKEIGRSRLNWFYFTHAVKQVEEGYGDDEELVPHTVGAEDSQSQCYPGHVKAPPKAFVAPKTNPKRIRPMLSRLAKAGNINYVHITDSEDVSTISYRRFSLPEKTCVHTCEISEGYASPPECCGFCPRELEPSTFLCFGLNATVYSK